MNYMNPILGMQQKTQQPVVNQASLSNMRESANMLKQAMNMMQGSGNPMQMMSAQGANNPNVSKVFDYINQNGGDAQKAFYSMANQMGVNPEEVLGMLK